MLRDRSELNRRELILIDNTFQGDNQLFLPKIMGLGSSLAKGKVWEKAKNSV